MANLDAFEQRIFNAGERLIPGVTHDTAEVVRHKSSYVFFKKVIENDMLSGFFSGPKDIRILDVGCGVGHGTYMLSDIPGAVVTGVDCSEESIVYARLHYERKNITYKIDDAIAFIENMSEFDYVVSRHALEHIPDGLNAIINSKFIGRLMVNVPFKEPEGNPHHHVHYICQDSFLAYRNAEIFYEGLNGTTLSDAPEDPPPNSIVCVSSKAPFPEVRSQLSFPLPPWQPEYLQGKWLKVFDGHNDLCLLGKQLSSRELAVSSRESNVGQREADLSSREMQITQRMEAVGKRESELVQRESLLNERDLHLVHRESELERSIRAYESRIPVKIYRKIKSFLP